MRLRSLLYALIVALPGVGAGAADFQFGVGVHVGQNRNGLAATQRALAQLGVSSFRDDVFWHRIETKRGVLAFPANLKDLDDLVTNAVTQGRRPLLILDYGNPLYDDGGQIHSPEGIAAYVRYVRFVVRHFRGRVDQFEVWNEWNIGGGGTPAQKKARHGNPQEYAALLRAAYNAIKAENPSATVIGGAFAGYDYDWIDAFGRAGGFESLDGFSAHPYVFSAGPARGTPELALTHLDELKRRIDHLAPGKDVRIYVTEEGWPAHAGDHGVSAATVAAYLQRFMLLAMSRPWIAGVWWYDLFDDGDDAQNKEHRFGLLSKEGAAKPAFQAFIDVRPLLAAPTRPTVETTADGHIAVVAQRADGKRVKASWLATSEQPMQVTPQ
ncbi:MAG TPA: hypothetical protein VG994_11555 [Steroidobacteraceae bacterium]|nr:hypothetical protein [Steroidobacteraceae bacterium]